MRAAEFITVLGRVGAPAWVPAGAIFSEDFANQRSWPRPFPSEMVDLRASNQYVPNADGTLLLVAPGILPISNAYMACEVAATNNILNTSTFATGWSTGDVSLVSATAPDNSSTAVTLKEDGANNNHQISLSQLLATGSNDVTFYVKPRTRGWCFVQLFQNTGSVDRSAYFNLSGAGSVGTTNNLVSASISLSGNGFYRCSILGSPTNATNVVVVGAATGDGGRTYTGTANAAAIDVWAPQDEFATSFSSPIMTTSVAATRAANAVQFQRTGMGRLVLTFDDNSAQTISGIATGSQYTIPPASLNRPLVKQVTGYVS